LIALLTSSFTIIASGMLLVHRYSQAVDIGPDDSAELRL
jgi:hypothetical protein